MSYIGTIQLAVADKSSGTTIAYQQDDKYIVSKISDIKDDHIIQTENGDLITSCDSFEVIVSGNRSVFEQGDIQNKQFTATLNPYQWKKVLNHGLVGKLVNVSLSVTNNKLYAQYLGLYDHEYIDGVME